MVKWLAVVKALKTSSKAQTNDHFTLYPSLIHCPNWKMRPLISKHKTTGTMHWNTNLAKSAKLAKLLHTQLTL